MSQLQNTNSNRSRNRLLYVDCSSGISGDMFLAALCDLSAQLPAPETRIDIAALEDIFRRADIKLSIRLSAVERMGGPGRHLDVDWPEGQPLRHLEDLTAIIERLKADEKVKQRSIMMLKRLAEAEAFVHGTDLSHVHFHEVGAIDTLVDVFGACWALEQLGVDAVHCGLVPWFGGFVDCSHGRMALPAPATLQLLHGKPFIMTEAREELITPTGALILDALVDRFDSGGAAGCFMAPESGGDMNAKPAKPQYGCSGGSLRGGIFQGSGIGYGSREPSPESDWPGRGLRLHLFQTGMTDLEECARQRAGRDSSDPLNFQDSSDLRDSTSAMFSEQIWELSCHIDHLSGEHIGHAIEEIMSAGALDVLWLPGITKKNRPGGELRVLCACDPTRAGAGHGRITENQPTHGSLEHVQAAIFRHTHTLGLRCTLVERLVLPRRAGQAATAWGNLKTKEYDLQGHTYSRIEYEELARAARERRAGLSELRIDRTGERDD